MASGVLAAVLAAACYECGYLLQALEAKVAPEELGLRPALLVRLGSRRRWLAGMVLSLLGAGLQTLALARAPVTVVQPVLALGLIGLLVLARVRLHERISRAGMAGAVLVVLGVAAVGIANPARTSHVSSAPAFVALVAPIAVVTMIPFVLRGRVAAGSAVAAAAGGDALAAVALKLTADALASGRLPVGALAALGAAVAGALALTAEMTALRTLPATRTAPPVLGAQVIVPAVIAVAAFGEPASATLLIGIGAAGVGAGLLGSSRGVAGPRGSERTAEAEALADRAGGRGQGAEPLAG
ncbi:MAG TPA: DMT family transporter [Thermoleophilaceae bacterium]